MRMLFFQFLVMISLCSTVSRATQPCSEPHDFFSFPTASLYLGNPFLHSFRVGYYASIKSEGCRNGTVLGADLEHGFEDGSYGVGAFARRSAMPWGYLEARLVRYETRENPHNVQSFSKYWGFDVELNFLFAIARIGYLSGSASDNVFLGSIGIGF